MAESLDEKMKLAEEILDEFENIHQIGRVSAPTELENILNLKYNQLEKLQHIQCSEYGFLLAQYAYYIQRVHNKESASLKWVKEQIDTIVASQWFNYEGWIKYETRIKLIAKENNALAKLVKQQAFLEQKLERISFLGARIDKMAEMMENLGRAKRYQVKAG